MDAKLIERAAAVLPSLTHLDTSRMPPGYVYDLFRWKSTPPHPVSWVATSLNCLLLISNRSLRHDTPHQHRYPRFVSHGDGCRVVDADGRSYIDYMSSFGPVLLGHHHPVVDAAVKVQQKLGDCLAVRCSFLNGILHSKCALPPTLCTFYDVASGCVMCTASYRLHFLRRRNTEGTHSKDGRAGRAAGCHHPMERMVHVRQERQRCNGGGRPDRSSEEWEAGSPACT
jgi:hypothetical protein